MRAVTRGTKRTIAGVLATGVILFAGIAGQAQASADGCKVTFGGWITTADGDKATFGGIAHAVEPEGPVGVSGSRARDRHQRALDRGPFDDLRRRRLCVRLLRPGQREPSSFGTQASIFGTATIDGEGSFDYQIDVTDLGEPGTSDTYRIRLSNGYDSGVQTLDRRKRPDPLVADTGGAPAAGPSDHSVQLTGGLRRA